MPANHTITDADRPDDLRALLSARLGSGSPTLAVAAKAIGVTRDTLRKHLAGEHIRSDSACKYRAWLAGQAPPVAVFRQRPGSSGATSGQNTQTRPPLPPAGPRPRYVVDIFSGCGGLSLGFDLLVEPGATGRPHFRTVMALDQQAAAVGVFNDNHPGPAGRPVGVARQVDLTEFRNEAEVLAFYLDHVARLHGDLATRTRLLTLDGGLVGSFLSEIGHIDSAFLGSLGSLVDEPDVRAVVSSMVGVIARQSAVQGFQERLKLPVFGRRGPSLPLVLWADAGLATGGPAGRLEAPDPRELARAAARWNSEFRALADRETGAAKGQLTASGRRIAAFVAAAGSDAYRPVVDAWCDWSARRQRLRATTFGRPGLADRLRALVGQTYPVSVLLGGPPCQGFSRIGRGKIRSLHEVSVHAHQDGDAGDARNRLYVNYVMVVSALRPEVFAFENVPQFQSTVKVGRAEFLATRMLTEAIATISGENVAYTVQSRTLDASRHGVPQTRQRFFMLGVRSELSRDRCDAASVLLDLPERAEVSLGTALEGLPGPRFCAPAQGETGLLAAEAELAYPVAGNRGPAGDYLRWVGQPAGGKPGWAKATDAHVARATREDDALFYELIGPGRRWMDYRADRSPTLRRIRAAVEALGAMADRNEHVLPAGAPGRDELRSLSMALDGSLPIRLLLEQIGRRGGDPHHLLRDAYLGKSANNHGDWLTRLDSRTPCRTVVAHMARDTYGYVHPSEPRTLSVREAARVQAFPDWFRFRAANMSEAFRMIGNAVPPLLSHQLAERIAAFLHGARSSDAHGMPQDQWSAAS